MDVITADIPSGVALRCVAETHYEFALAVPSQPLLLRMKAVSGFIVTPSSKLDKTAKSYYRNGIWANFHIVNVERYPGIYPDENIIW